MTHLGRQTRLWRAKHGLLLYDMSKGMNVKPSQLSAWEIGRKPWPPAMKRKARVWMRRQEKLRRFVPMREKMRAKQLRRIARMHAIRSALGM